MSEWWTYTLSDFLLFSPRTYYRLFEIHNAAVWPAHLVALAGSAAILLLPRKHDAGGRATAAILAAGWIFAGWTYHWQRYSSINWAASYYAIAFAVEALLLVWFGVVRGAFALHPAAGPANRTGAVLFALAVFGQPLIAPLLGRGWSQSEMFALAPDPTAIATLGLLVAAAGTSWLLLVIPLLWCAISGATLWTMNSPDALVPPIAAVLALAFMAFKRRAFTRAPTGRGSSDCRR